MKIIFFPAGCLSGYALYLLRDRAGRVAMYMGDTASFAALRTLLNTNNPVTAGCWSFECWVDPKLALRLCCEWFNQWVLGGADQCSVPHLFVVHLEPCPWSVNAVRTVVHFAFSNVHLGVLKSFRPYVHLREFTQNLEWQNTVNRLYGWRVPSLTPAGFNFERQRDPFSGSVIELLRQGLQACNETTEPIDRRLERVIDACNSSSVWTGLHAEDSAPEADYEDAILVVTNDTYCIQFRSGFRVKIGASRTSPTALKRTTSVRDRTTPDIARTSISHVEADAIFCRLTERRAALFEKDYSHRWFDPFIIDDRIRRLLLEVRKPEIEPHRNHADREHDVAKQRPRQPEKIHDGPVVDY